MGAISDFDMMVKPKNACKCLRMYYVILRSYVVCVL